MINPAPTREVVIQLGTLTILKEPNNTYTWECTRLKTSKSGHISPYNAAKDYEAQLRIHRPEMFTRATAKIIKSPISEGNLVAVDFKRKLKL